jgi:hypothetical protein
MCLIEAGDSIVILYHRLGMTGLTGGYEMNLLKTKSWSTFDLVWFKIACVTFGLLVGAFLSNYVIQSAWLIGVIFILTYIKTVHFYFFSKA